MIKKTKQNKTKILELIIILLITLIFNLICNEPVHDEIWNYGFSYNISTGLIPYKDFNMVVTPLFPILGAIFLSIFGRNLMSYYIFNAIICTTIFYFIKKIIPKSYYIVYGIMLFFSQPNYNLFCLLLLYILMLLEDKKSKDILIGIVIGLAFISKQTIGMCLFIPTIFYKDIKKVYKRIVGFIIPNIILLIYLIYHNTLYQFIDYIFLGIGDFAEKNSNTYTSCLIILITSIIFLIYKYIKTKDIKLIYILCFQCMSFPIIDPYHIMIPFIPTFTFFLKELNLNKKIITIAFIIFITSIFSYNIYLCTTKEYPYPNNTEVYKYRKMNNNVLFSINKIKNYLKTVDGKIFIIDRYAYLLKLEMSIKIDKYDLLNDGNLGKNGQYKIIKEIDHICKKEKCIFLLNEKEIDNRISQYNQEILKYIDKTYKKIGNVDVLSIYEN